MDIKMNKSYLMVVGDKAIANLEDEIDEPIYKNTKLLLSNI